MQNICTDYKLLSILTLSVPSEGCDCVMYSVLLLCVLLSITHSCIIEIEGDSWPHKPAIITTASGDPVLPSGDGDVRELVLGDGEVYQVSCPGTHLTLGPRQAWIQCGVGDTFLWWEEGSEDSVNTADFVDLGCIRRPSDAAKIIDSCGKEDQYDVIEIGFDISGDDLIRMVTVCHDFDNARTLWSKHILLDEIEFQDKNNERPAWDGDFFDFDADFYYHLEQQHEAFTDILGSSSLADQYLSGGEYYLARGHLAPNADYIFYSWMDTTFYLINVAPQWQNFNARNWAYLEEGVRELAISHSSDFVVYTGTSGTMQLEDVHGKMVDIHLYQDKLPVPMFYWKIIHDPIAGTGVAAVGVNNPHLKEITQELILCPPLSHHTLLDSLTGAEDITHGYLYLCRVEDLAESVPEVPQLPEMGLLE